MSVDSENGRLTFVQAEAATGLPASAFAQWIADGRLLPNKHFVRDARRGDLIIMDAFQQWLTAQPSSQLAPLPLPAAEPPAAAPPAYPLYEPRPAFRRSVPRLDEPAQLYRQFDAAGRLLYVGIARNVLDRLAGHQRASHWVLAIARIDVTLFPTRTAALDAELEAIRTEKPLHNKAGVVSSNAWPTVAEALALTGGDEHE